MGVNATGMGVCGCVCGCVCVCVCVYVCVCVCASGLVWQISLPSVSSVVCTTL